LLLNMALIIVIFSEMSHPGIDVHTIRTWTLHHPEITVAIAATNIALLVACIAIYTRRPAPATAPSSLSSAIRRTDAEITVASRP
jgi:hypothetical protein